MLVYKAKLRGNQDQDRRLDEALRTGLFVRNQAIRYLMDGHGKNRYHLNRYCRILAKEFS